MTELSVSETVAKYTYGTWRAQKGWKPMHVVKAEGCRFWDDKGNGYLDMSGQLMCMNLGHQNPAVIEAIVEQARKLAFIAPGHATEIRAKLAMKLLEVMPKGLEKFFFATSGTEANECAFKIARLATGKHKIIARYNSYHGSTAGALAATGDFRRWSMEPLMGKIPGVLHGPEANCYRCPFGRHVGNPAHPSCELACADYLAYMIDNEQNVAAVIVEPVVGTNGVLVPPKDYLPKLKAICEKRGVLMIADEVMSGWGRTGEWFAVDNWGVVPDILTTAKGITGAMAPLGVVATTRAIADHFEDNFFAHGHTYESHPLTLAPAVAAIDEYKRLGLIQRSKAMGAVLGKKLMALKDKHPSIGDVRGIGMFWAVELVKNRDTKEPFATMKDKADRKPLLIDQVVADMMKRNVSMVGWVSHLVLAPPLIIEEADMDEAVTALDAALVIADQQVA